ncbi:MAG: DUF2610 domain-containing protein [Candidatus Acidiferrum sp.]|jgi:TPR repeat protein
MSLPKRLPYPGLRAFTREESDLFFGRESSIDTMVDCLAADRFMAVLGPSGSGKSSLVRTGLLDALELGLLSRAGSHWKIADMHPGGQPMKQLAAALLAVRAGPAADQTDLDLMTAYLRQGPRAVVEWASAGNIPDGYNLLLLVDQFEELFRYADYAQREEAEAFVATLLESSSARGVSIYVVLTMRSEYLGACATIEGLAERISAGLYLAPRMDRDECREAIEGPASVVGFKVENALVNRLLNDLGSFAPWQVGEESDLATRLARQADQLPLMQHVLNRLWLRASAQPGGGTVELKLAEYEQIGGLSGALDAHGAEVTAELGSGHLIQIERIFRALVSGSSPATAVRRPCRMSELIEAAGGRRDDVVAIVEAFRAAGCNFLRTTEESLSDHVIVDISHESLIRQWTPLRGWLENEGRAGAAWRRLAVAEERYSKREGGLLTGLDLQNMAAWWESSAPTPSWAARHGGNFDAVSKFLDESKRAEALRLEAEREEQLRERRRLIRFAVGVSVALAIFVGLGIWNKMTIGELKRTQSALDQKSQEAGQERDNANKARDAAQRDAKTVAEVLNDVSDVVTRNQGVPGASGVESELMKTLSPYRELMAKIHAETVGTADLSRNDYLLGKTFETIGLAKEALDSYRKAYEQGKKDILDQLAAGHPIPEDLQISFIKSGCRYSWFLLDIGEDKKGDAVLQEMRNLVGQLEAKASSTKLLIAYSQFENLESRDAMDHKKTDEESRHTLAAFNLSNSAIAHSNSNPDIDTRAFEYTVYRNRSFDVKGDEREELRAKACKIADSLMRDDAKDIRSIKARSQCLLDQAWSARGKGKTEEAAEKVRKAREVVETALQVDPMEQELLLTMARFENFLSDLAQDRRDENLRFAHAASAKAYIVRALSGRTLFQSNTTEIKDLYNGCCKWLPSGDFPDSDSDVELGFYKDIVEAVSPTLDAFPNAPSFAYVAADASARMAQIVKNNTERRQEAIAYLTKALESYDKTEIRRNLQELSSFSDNFSTYCTIYTERAKLYASVDRLDLMHRDVAKMEEICKPALDKYPWDIYLRNSFRRNAAIEGQAQFEKRNYPEAIKRLEYASKWGMADSTILLARMYREALGVEKNETKAKELETLAAGQTLTSVPLQADLPGGKSRFLVYVLDWPDEYPYKDKGIDDQVIYLKQAYDGTLPPAVVESFRNNQKICREDKIPFARFMLYYFNFADENEQVRQNYARARVMAEEKRWKEAAQAIETAYSLEPESTTILNAAENIYHDGLFNYSRAYELNAKRVDLGEGGYDFVEKNLTTSRFEACANLAAIAWLEASDRIRLVMSSIQFACLSAERKTDAALIVGRRLRKDVAGLKTVGWVFSGTKNFVNTSPAFADKAPQWVSLFEALEQGDEKKALAALDALGVPAPPDKK